MSKNVTKKNERKLKIYLANNAAKKINIQFSTKQNKKHL